MYGIKINSLQRYLSQLVKEKLIINRVSALGVADLDEKPLKEYGYGTPLRIDFDAEGDRRSLVLNTVKPGGFGHERMEDRAAIMLWQFRSFNTLPKHVRALDVGAVAVDGSAKTLRDCVEVFLITELMEGTEYFHDLNRILEEGKPSKVDLQRCSSLAEYLADIHSAKRDDPGMYVRRIRELVGHNECVFGLTDSYPSNLNYITPAQLADIEKLCIDWRWRIKPLTHRLSQVHGDFHPWNIMFHDGVDFSILDRSRGEWGEPADDVAALSINFLFYALQQTGSLDGPFRNLWDVFYDVYLTKTGDYEILRVIQPFLCWRALVVASPIWYPHLTFDVRSKLLGFARNILEVERLDPYESSSLLEEKS